MYQKVILASQSPRRRELLQQLGMDFEVRPAKGEEHSQAKEPVQFVQELAMGKAMEIAEQCQKESQEMTLVIGADTIVALGTQILGKPVDEADAVLMLQSLQGRTHQVYTGVALILVGPNGIQQRKHFYEKTNVTFAPMTKAEIQAYVDTKDPMDKAGAYGIQSGAARYIAKIDGDYNNVVGLPIARLYQEMKMLEMDDENPQERLQKQFAFLLELDKEKFIGRQTYLSDGMRKENDAEHAWHMALMAVLLKEYANEEVDLLHVMIMILLHDVVEIDAGDTYAYDEEGKKTQAERERKAAERIFGLLPEDQAVSLRAYFEEFEAWETPEAKFAHAMDNFQPLMLNAASGGKSWEEHDVHLQQVLGRNQRSAEGSELVWEYAYQTFIQPAVENGLLKND